ncbi:related to WD repeat-containing protein JIP5 [Ustilago bromivora]|uniref:WD repeat-containing protein JIP5 n=1 Tax=Ustilago bromivora TaxID=307758 RepID=A0A1K0H763_9BASI|nr:related to WD repeat-containing protein JIP5 [Ustilago bromivora]SYW81059.1 related to WD repeat-containing protein JIP5 [Ustilago bromivora]
MDIPLSSDALDLSFHPDENTNLLAVGLISGKIQLINYDDYASAPSSSRTPAPPSSSPPSKKIHISSDPATTSPAKLYEKVWISRPSKKSCRGLAFHPTTPHIYSISKDKSLFKTDVETGRVVDSWIRVHDAAPSRVLPIDEGMIVTGDDDGVVRLFDPRKGGEVRRWEHHFDWITDLLFLPDLPIPKKGKGQAAGRKSKTQLKKERKKARQAALVKAQQDQSDEQSQGESSDEDAGEEKRQGRERLIVTSGDGSLSSIDLRSSGPTSFELSQDQEDELLSITSIRSSSKLVVGTQLGILSLWNPSRGLLDHVDRVPGHPASVDTLVTLDNETVLTGSSDGLVRVVQILPSKLLGVIASHDGLPVERIRRKTDVLGSIGHSHAVKFTDLTPLLDDDDREGEGEEAEAGALGVVGLDADADSDDDEEEQEEEGFAGLQNEPSPDDSDEDDAEASEEEEEESEDEAPPSSKGNKGKSQSFFTDL